MLLPQDGDGPKLIDARCHASDPRFTSVVLDYNRPQQPYNFHSHSHTIKDAANTVVTTYYTIISSANCSLLPLNKTTQWINKHSTWCGDIVVLKHCDKHKATLCDMTDDDVREIAVQIAYML